MYAVDLIIPRPNNWPIHCVKKFGIAMCQPSENTHFEIWITAEKIPFPFNINVRIIPPPSRDWTLRSVWLSHHLLINEMKKMTQSVSIQGTDKKEKKVTVASVCGLLLLQHRLACRRCHPNFIWLVSWLGGRWRRRRRRRSSIWADPSSIESFSYKREGGRDGPTPAPASLPIDELGGVVVWGMRESEEVKRDPLTARLGSRIAG